MGTSAAERIALEIQSSADLTAMREARMETANLKTDTDKLTATVDQSREAWARAGGDYTRFTKILSELANGEVMVATAVEATTLAEAQAIQTTKNLTVATQEANIQLTAHAEQTNVVGRVHQNVAPKVHTAANGLAILSQNALMGTGSMAGLAMAAGNVTTGIAMMTRSATIAASATGLGALVTTLAVLLPLLTEADEKTEKWGRSLGDYSVRGLEIAAQRNRERAQELIKQLEDFGKLSTNQQIAKNAESVATTGSRYNAGIVDQLKANADEQLRIDETLNKAKRDLDKQREREEDERAKRDLKRADTLGDALQRSYYESRDKITETEAQQEINKLRRQANAQLLEIEQLDISEQRKSELRVAVAQSTEEQIAAIQDDADRKKKKKDDEIAKAAAAKQRQMVDALASQLESIASSSHSLSQVLTRALLEPIEHYLEGVAAKEGIEAYVSAAAGDIFGAARHAAVASLALAASFKVSQIAASGGGGGGGTIGGGGGSSGTFSPTADNGGRNPTVINLITQNPFSGETLSVVQYELNRNGVLKRPVNLPPTTGLAYAGAH